MLIIEGSDLVGKTELCEKLIRFLSRSNYPIIPQHFGLLENSWDFYWDYLGYVNRRTIMDRFIMSEVVYGNVVRNGSRISPNVYRLLDGHLRQQASVTVVIVADPTWLDVQLTEKYDPYREKFSPVQIKMINRGFSDLICHDGPEWAKEFRCDCDFVYEINDCQGFPSSNEDFVQQVAECFLKRQCTLDRLQRDAS